MGMFAGIDLMAKFFAGSDTGSVGPRFRTFMGQFFTGLSPADAETIYQLRNAIMHSFGFYSRDKKTGREYRFQLFDGRKSGPLVHHLKAEYYRVDVIAFHDAFERAVNKFATAIDGDSALQSKFTAMFLNYGWMQIG
jgi:hypothetical protein